MWEPHRPAGYCSTDWPDRGYKPEQVRYIILTHIHLDHGGGASQLMQHCPQATLLVHPKGAGHMIELIEEHGRCAEVETEFDHDATTARLQNLLYKSYLNFGVSRLRKSEFVDFLAGDIEINVQGIAARRARLQKNNN